MDANDLDVIWNRDILPPLKIRSCTSTEPVTVFLGGQPAAGKTRVQQHLVETYGDWLLPIVGDDFRKYHPDYKRLIREDPLSMPYETARAAGYWTGKAVEYADTHGVSCIIEGTWRNADTVLNEAERAASFGRRTHAVLLAVPPVLSRLGMLSRFYWDLAADGQARWTPPEAHERTVAVLPENVHTIATSGSFDRLSVMDRSGDFLYDGADPADFEAVWSDRFKGGLGVDGMAAEQSLVGIESIRRRFDVGLAESEPIIQTIRRDLGIWDSAAK